MEGDREMGGRLSLSSRLYVWSLDKFETRKAIVVFAVPRMLRRLDK